MDDLYSPAPCSFTAGVALAACATRPYYTSSIDLTSPIPFELTAASLGLMLVFRTNESYARFIKAHEAWNLIMSRQGVGKMGGGGWGDRGIGGIGKVDVFMMMMMLMLMMDDDADDADDG